MKIITNSFLQSYTICTGYVESNIKGFQRLLLSESYLSTQEGMELELNERLLLSFYRHCRDIIILNRTSFIKKISPQYLVYIIKEFTNIIIPK